MRACSTFALVTFALGAAALLGWLFHIDALKRIHPAWVNMKANTAICLMLAATSLLLLRQESASPAKRHLAGAFAFFIAMIGLATLTEHLFAWELGIDQLFFHETHEEAGQSFPGRMGVAASLNFVFLGLALGFLSARMSRHQWLVDACALASLLITSLVFLYYFYGVEKFTPIAKYATIALHTVVAFLCLCAGIFLAPPTRGVTALLLGESAGSMLARRMLPFALLMPLVLGWLRVMGQQAGLYGTGFGSALYAGSSVMLLFALIAWTASVLNRADRAAQRAERAMRAGLVLPGQLAGRRLKPWLAYAALIVSIALVTGIRLALIPILGMESRLTLFLIPVMVSAYLGGLWPGLLGTVLCALVGNYLFYGPALTWSIPSPADGVRLLIFGLVGVTISALSESLHRSRSQAAVQAAAITQAQQRVVTILQSIRDGFCVIDAQSRFTYFNEAAKRLLAQHGLDAKALLGHHVLEEIFPDTAESEAGRALRRTLTERVPTAVEAYHEPWQRWLNMRHFPTADGGVSTFFQDITDRKHTEEALRASEERYRSLVAVITDVPWTTNADGEFTKPQPAWEKYTGQSWQNYRGLGWLQAVHPDERAAFRANWVRARHEHAVREFGGRLWHAATQHFRYFTAHATPLLNPDGSVREWVGTCTDVHDQKTAALQLEKLVDERTAKLRETVEELESFSYSVAHDLRAPLRSMQGFSEILLTEHAPRLNAEGQGFLRRIAASAGRMDNLIQDVLNYSRVVRAELPLEAVDVEPLLRGIIDTYPMLAAEKAEIILKGEFPVVLANEAMLTQIFSNLLGNAVKFVTPGLKPSVRIWAEPTEFNGSSGLPQHAPAKERRRMTRIFFRDNGIGIAPQQHDKIFEMFQRVDSRYEGTGIGLTIVKRAVERMNGKVGLESHLGQGSTFWIELQQA